MRNAVNYSFDDSTIHIAVKQNGENLCIQFTNCGNTIPKEKLVRILNSFIVLMLHEVPEAEVQDWVLQLQKKSLSFITEQLPQK